MAIATPQPRQLDAATSHLSNPARPEQLATISYRSRAVHPFSELQLSQLLESARKYNRANGLTGLLVYDEGRFFQWIEGSPEKLSTVWNSIQRDPRHTDIQIMGNQSVPLRFFGDWDMRFSVRKKAGVSAPVESADVSHGLVDNLFRRPQGSADIANDLQNEYAPAANQDKSTNGARHVEPALLDAVKTIALPQLFARHNAPQQLLAPVDLRVGELVHRLMLAEPESSQELIAQFYAETHSLRQLCTQLLEPAARGLGDLWGTDDCSEVDVSIGLSRLQSSMRESVAGQVPSVSVNAPAVLIVPQPGEMHLLSAVLDAESLHQRGWAPHVEFPASNTQLQKMVSNTWFDALDLTLSTAFTRDHWMPRVAETIAHVRKASRNPALVIIVGGRGFIESTQTGRKVGADYSSQTASDVAPLILQSLRKLSPKSPK